MDIFLIQRVKLKLFRKMYDYESRYGIIALYLIENKADYSRSIRENNEVLVDQYFKEYKKN